jgi:hypothetical protein
MKRPLSDDERQILAIAQESLGPQNTESDVFFTEDGRAVIFAKTSDGTPCIMLHLTNLAAFCRNGSTTRADIIRDIEYSLGHH